MVADWPDFWAKAAGAAASSGIDRAQARKILKACMDRFSPFTVQSEPPIIGKRRAGWGA
jgi:hypothetical protein